MFGLQEVTGGSPWGSGTFAGRDGSRQPSEAELKFAHYQGSYFAGVAQRLTESKGGDRARI